MKTPSRLIKLRQSLALGLLPILLAAAFTGCVTQQQVRRIVTESNAAILSSQLGADLDPLKLPDKTAGRSNAIEEASARIDAFIAAHPEQKTTAAALRIRQAMMLLAGGDQELATAAFEAADTNDLFTTRDLTLKELSPDLVWWFRASQGGWQDPDYTHAAKAMADFLNVQDRLTATLAKHPENEGIRDYVAETRAWIGLKRAGATANLTNAALVFSDALKGYAAILSTNDVALLQCGCGRTKTAPTKAIPSAVRRCLRTETLLGYARSIKTSKTAVGAFAPEIPPAFADSLRP